MATPLSGVVLLLVALFLGLNLPDIDHQIDRKMAAHRPLAEDV